MICANCNNSGIYNEANGLGFYYCRTCKIEVNLESPYISLETPVAGFLIYNTSMPTIIDDTQVTLYIDNSYDFSKRT